MQFTLAIIPSVILLRYIYKKDKREKESFNILLKCFLLGIAIIIPAFIIESLLDGILGALFYEGSVPYAVFDGFIVAACTEEGLKYAVLKKKTWKNKEFNCSFDGIVYAVFVSLGFATFENILYVVQSGLSTAIMRMFTAVPGHAFDAVFMGYFYSKAKRAEIDGDEPEAKKNKKKALFVPIIAHGFYDSLIMTEEDIAGAGIVLLGFFLWVIVVIAEYILSISLVKKASDNDAPFYELPETEVETDDSALADADIIGEDTVETNIAETDI